MPNHTDFNGDGRDDVYWRLRSPLPDAPLQMLWWAQPDGSFVNSLVWRLFDPVPADTFKITFGDFNGDGFDDMFFSANGDGQFLRVEWISRGDGTFLGNSVSLWEGWFDEAWRVQASGDFDHDGRTDLLIRHDDGWIVQWLAEPDATFTDNTAATSWVHPDWHVAGVGDFNDDGHEDLLLRHNDGWLVEWLTQLDGSFSANSAATSWIHPDWRVAGTGDFDNDGHDDLLLRHDDGWLIEWLGQSDGSFSPNNVATSWLHPTWHVVAIGDYNGDGHDDLLLRHDDGTVTNWLAEENGTFFANGAVATYLVDLAYQTEPGSIGTGPWHWDYDY